MIAKPLTPFTNMMREETSNVAISSSSSSRRSLFYPVGKSKEARTITMFSEKNRSSSFEKPSATKNNNKNSSVRRFKRRQRHVSFCQQLESVHAAPACHSESVATDLWHSQFDFQRFLKSAQQEAKTIRISDDEEFLNGVDKSHSIAIRLAESINKNLKDTTLLNRISTRLDMKNTGLAKWCMETPHRGLERIASKQLRHSKHYIRKEIKGLVLLSAKKEGDDDDAISVVSYGSASTSGTGRSSSSSRRRSSKNKQLTTPEKLAQQYEQRTKESGLFARMMGLADELAAQRVYSGGAEDEEQFL